MPNKAHSPQPTKEMQSENHNKFITTATARPNGWSFGPSEMNWSSVRTRLKENLCIKNGVITVQAFNPPHNEGKVKKMMQTLFMEWCSLLPKFNKLTILLSSYPSFVALKRVSRQIYPFRSYQVVPPNHPKLRHLKKSIIKLKDNEGETTIRPNRITEGYLFICFFEKMIKDVHQPRPFQWSSWWCHGS